MLQNELTGVFHPPFSDTFTRPFLPSKTLTPPSKNTGKSTYLPPNYSGLTPFWRLHTPPTSEWNQPRPAATTPQSPPLSAVRRSLVAGLGLHQLGLSDASTWCFKESDGEFSDPTWGWLRWKKKTSQINAGLVYVVHVYMLMWWKMTMANKNVSFPSKRCEAFLFGTLFSNGRTHSLHGVFKWGVLRLELEAWNKKSGQWCFFLFWHFFLFVDFLGMEADGFCFKTCPVFVLGVSLGVFVPPKHMEVMFAYPWRNHSIWPIHFGDWAPVISASDHQGDINWPSPTKLIPT